jgi:anion-transporting  ArsA/GET3 family ATPase
MTRSVLVTGAGGVGKTTVAAAVGATAAAGGARTLVLTVDPARRLAQALGLEHLGNDPTPVPGAAGLDAAMLDVTASWESIIDRHAPAEVAARLRTNKYFRAIADRFPAAQSYAAGEQMVEYLEDGRWDLVIIDTPPSGGGIDFFTAPARMRELVGGRLLSLLTGASLPGRRAIYRLTARPALRLLDAFLGGPLLEDIAGFFLDLRTIYDGLSKRATIIERAMARAVTFVVTTADPAPLREARRFYDDLGPSGITPTAVVFNRSLPAAWSEARAEEIGSDPETAVALRENLARWGQEARRQADARRDFAARHGTVLASIPWLPKAPTSLDDLRDLVEASEGIPFSSIGMDGTGRRRAR